MSAPITQERESQIAELLKNGHSAERITREMRCSKATVVRIRDRLGIPPHSNGVDQIGQERTKMATKLFLQGHSIRYVTEVMRMSWAAARRIKNSLLSPETLEHIRLQKAGK